MRRLTIPELRSRYAFDYRGMMALHGASIERIEAYENDEARRRRRLVTPEEGEAGHASLYLVTYMFPMLTGPGQTMPRATISLKLETGGYPFSEPWVQQESRPLIWSPHVMPTTGIVCIGPGWRAARGRMTAFDLVQFLARIFNGDEPYPGDEYGGFNPAAQAYWRNVMKCQPLTPDLEYPTVPPSVTHGIEEPKEERGFRLVAEPAFRLVGSTATNGAPPAIRLMGGDQ